MKVISYNLNFFIVYLDLLLVDSDWNWISSHRV